MCEDLHTVEFDRRTLLRNAVIAGAGFATLGTVVAPVARATSGTQPGWRWCNLCAEIFWPTNPGPVGGCPYTGGPHHAGSGTIYSLKFGSGGSGDPTNPASRGQQAGWHYCTACTGLFWPTGPNVCNAGAPSDTWPYIGPHTAGPTVYDVEFWGDGTIPGDQVNWRYCTGCGVLFWGGGNGGVCPGGVIGGGVGPHTPGSTIYQLPD
jgi:hypothetical protein